jgi:hypothetical protein
MNDPIRVTIKNNQDKPRIIRWTAKHPVSLPANGEVDIPYEPWSCADRNQRQSILAECSNKWVSFTLHVADKDGNFQDIEYDPSIMLHVDTAPPVKQAVETKPLGIEVKHDDHSHIVIASGNPEAAGYGFKADTVKPPEQVAPGDHTIVAGSDMPKADKQEVGGFKAEKADARGITTTDVLNQKSADDTVKADFAKAVEEKRWDDALQLLADKFGKDKVTFTVRVIMSMKDYDAIVAKYKLS